MPNESFHSPSGAQFFGAESENFEPQINYDSIESAVPDLRGAVAVWEGENPDQQSVIIIAGPTASGKDRIVEQLGFSDDTTVHMSLDRYYRGAELQQKEDGAVNFSVPKALDKERVLADLDALRKVQIGEEVMVPVYDMKKSGRVGEEPVKAKRRIIVSGVYSLDLLTQIDTPFKWYMDASEATILRRKLVRDTSEKGIPEDVVKQRFEQNVKPALVLVEAQKEQARVTVKNEA